MPPVGRLLSIFTKIIQPKGSLTPMSILANQTLPTIKSIARQHYDTKNRQRYRCNINKKLSRGAKKGPYATFRWPTIDQQLANNWLILCHLLSIFLAGISFFGHISLLIYPKILPSIHMFKHLFLLLFRCCCNKYVTYALN